MILTIVIRAYLLTQPMFHHQITLIKINNHLFKIVIILHLSRKTILQIMHLIHHKFLISPHHLIQFNLHQGIHKMLRTLIHLQILHHRRDTLHLKILIIPINVLLRVLSCLFLLLLLLLIILLPLHFLHLLFLPRLPLIHILSRVPFVHPFPRPDIPLCRPMLVCLSWDRPWEG